MKEVVFVVPFCRDCRFFEPIVHEKGLVDDRRGLCRRYPPAATGRPLPVPHETDFCGEFREPEVRR